MKKSLRRHQKISVIKREGNVAELKTSPTGELIISFPIEAMDALQWRHGDTLKWRVSQTIGDYILVNVSVRVLYVARYLRDFRSLSKALNDPLNPLHRVIVNCRAANRRTLIAVSVDVFAKGQF